MRALLTAILAILGLSGCREATPPERRPAMSSFDPSESVTKAVADQSATTVREATPPMNDDVPRQAISNEAHRTVRECLTTDSGASEPAARQVRVHFGAKIGDVSVSLVVLDGDGGVRTRSDGPAVDCVLRKMRPLSSRLRLSNVDVTVPVLAGHRMGGVE